MRIRLTTAMALLVALVAAAPADAGRTPRLPDCATSGQSLAASSTARVYALRGSVFACRYGIRRRVRLGSDGECQGDFRASKPRLAGRYAGWVSTSCNLDASDDSVQIADLIRGRVVWSSVAATGDTATSNRDVTTFVRDFQMGADGTAVFLGVFDAGGDTLRVDSPLDLVQLRALSRDSGDGSEVVDEGQEIVPGSVALTRFGFFYRKGATSIFRDLDLSATEREAADGAARQRRCAPRRSRTVAATAGARVFELANNEMYACRYNRPRRVFVGTTDDCSDDSIGRDHVLAGRYVAYVSQECRVTTDDETVLVYDLNTGRRLHAGAAATGESTQPAFRQGALVRGMVMNSKGSVAWIGVYDGDGQPDTVAAELQVWRADRVTGLNGELIDQGADIDPGSLALAGDTVYWRDGPTAQSATLR
jgi:hypothetical protein